MIPVDQQQEGAVHTKTLSGGNGCQGNGKNLFQVNGALKDRTQFMHKADFEGFIVKETDQGLDLEFLALVFFMDHAEYGSQRVSAFAEAVQVLLEIVAVTTFFQNAPPAGRQQVFVPLKDVGAVAHRNDIPVPAAFPVHIGPRKKVMISV
jgi:hypothetical protein